MKQGLFFTATGLNSTTGINNVSVLAHLKIYETITDSIDCLSMYKGSQKAKELIQKHSNVSVRNCVTSISEQLLDIQNEHRATKNLSWDKIYHKLDVSELKNYDSFYLLNSLFKPSSKYTYDSKRVGVFPYEKDSILFDSEAIVIINLLAILKAHHEYKIPIHELCYEPNALTFKEYHKDFVPIPELYFRYYGYDKNEMKRLDSSQYYLQSIPLNPLCDYDKIYDLTFGFTNMKGSPTRKPYYDYMLKMDLQNKNIFVYDTIGDIGIEDRTINKHDYIDALKESRYTYIIPCHDTSCLSPYRFTESLFNDCLPIVHPDCIIEHISSSFDVDLTRLIGLNNFSEEYRLELLSYYKEKFCLVHKGFITN